MKKYLLIESQGEFDAESARDCFALASALHRQGAEVEIMLVQNGVTQARAGAKAAGLMNVLSASVKVLADEYSMRERALAPIDLMNGVRAAPIGYVIERMTDGWNVMWY